MNIGIPVIKVSLIIDLSGTFTWCHSFHNKNYQSTTAKYIEQNITITYYNNTFNGSLVDDSISVENNEDGTLNDFRIYFIDNQLKRYNEKHHYLLTQEASCSLGLGFKFPDNKYSFIHQLKNFHLINHLSFSIIQQKKIIFGGIPAESRVSKSHYSYCNIIDDSSNWNCHISKGLIRDKINNKTLIYNTSLLDSSISFTTDNQFNYVPKEFYDLLVNNYYRNIPYLIGHSLTGHKLYINEKNKPVDGELVLCIQDYCYSILLSNFWDCYDGYCDFHILKNTNETGWIMGSEFYTSYDVMFDYEDKKIHFYTNTEVKYIKEPSPISPSLLNNKHMSLTIIIIASIILSLGFGMLILIKIHSYLIKRT